jgi:hypothetical protein
MTNAPERIWIEGAVSGRVWEHDKQSCLSPHEYTRTDLIAAMIDEAVQAEREAIAASIEEMIQEEKRTLTPAHWLMTKADQDVLAMLASIVAAIRARKGGMEPKACDNPTSTQHRITR